MENKRQFREPDEATRQKMSFRKQGCNNPNYGKPRDEETKQKISQALSKYWTQVPSKNDNNKNDSYATKES